MTQDQPDHSALHNAFREIGDDVDRCFDGLLQVPGGEGGVVALVIIAIALSLGALLVSEWLAHKARRDD